MEAISGLDAKDLDDKCDGAGDDDDDEEEDDEQDEVPTAAELTKGTKVKALRSNTFEPGSLVGPSKKKEGWFVVKFDNDGKRIAKSLDNIRLRQ